MSLNEIKILPGNAYLNCAAIRLNGKLINPEKDFELAGKFVVACDFEEFGTEYIMFVKMKGSLADLVKDAKNADAFNLEKAEDLCRRLNHHSVDATYYVMEL